LAGSASASSGSVECAAVDPQQIQSFNSGISRPSFAATASVERWKSLAVPSREQPGKNT
jgi:hypothetical protein